MLAEDKIKAIADSIRVNPDDFMAALNDANVVDFAIPEIFVYNKEEMEALKKNIQEQHYKDGYKTGMEVLVKDAKKKLGIESDGKDMDLFLDEYKKKIIEETKTEPNKKIQELEGVNSSLKANLARIESEKEEIIRNLKRTELKTNALSSVQKDYLLSKSDIFALMSSAGFEIDDENGKVITKRYGETFRDAKTLDPLPFDVAFDEFAKEKGLLKAAASAPPQNPAPGRGGRTTTGKPAAVYSTYREMEADWKAQGKNTLSQEFLAKAEEYAKNNPDFFK